MVVIIDRLTKAWALMLPVNGMRINQFLSFDLVFNRGISLGLLSSQDTVMFIAVSAIIICITGMLIWYTYIVYKKEKLIIGHILALAGAFSNIVDRFIFNGVIDFIMLSFRKWSWPVFNVADISVVCGVFIMLFWYRK